MKKKNILLLTTVGGFIPQFETGSVKILKSLDFQIFYASDFTHSVYTPREKLLDELGVKRFQIPIKKSPLAVGAHRKAFFELVSLVRTYEIGCVHCHTPVGGFLGRMLGKYFGEDLKVIYTAHGFHFYQGAPVSSWVFYPVERYLARYTDALITINREDFERAGRWKLRDKGRVYQIPGVGIAKERLRLSKEEKERARNVWREQFGIPKDAPLLLSVGELNKNKNHEIVLRAMAKSRRKDLYYLIAGEGERREKLNREILSLGLNDRVFLLGYREEVAPLLAAADIFLFPSKREGLGMAALEAMAMGLPVIAADNRGSREYTVSGVNGYRCRWNDAKAFAKAIEILAGDLKKREAMGNAAENTSGRFAAEKTAQVMRRVYEVAYE